MSQLDEALRRLDGAVARLESAVADGALAGPDTDRELLAERNRLAEEVHRLRARAAEDARLRAEAAAAVRDALHDLRGAIGQPAGEMRGNA
jgi:hypothetical protein